MPNPSSSLKRYVLLSTLIHVASFLGLLILTPRLHLHKSEPIAVIMVELPKGTSEDVGLGTRQTTPEPQPLPKEVPPPPPPPPTPVKPPMAEPKADIKTPTPKPQKPIPPPLSPAEQKMKDALAKVNSQLHDRNKTPPASGPTTSEGYKYGTSNTPLAKLPPDVEYSRYAAMVRARIHREWIMPPGVKELAPSVRPTTRISVRISASGHITAASVSGRSSNASFDASAMRAVQRASPLPVPPESIRQLALTKGFTVDFVVR